ncbi:hypothetical protein GCM10022237_30920 [Nocardioides ginsengisoli]|uniref:Uncharacterized protein n=1 Tax=Nocardioides ginsengisoli TaxID=363868 RepID=A0ABW3VUT6_9ACTN
MSPASRRGTAASWCFSNYGLFSKKRVRALSRRGIAATYGTGEFDQLLVARRGVVVRNDDALIDTAWDDSRPLPEERGLDFDNDIDASSWIVLEWLTGISVTEEWMFRTPHPRYVLAGW